MALTHIFISHAGEDSELAERLARDLDASGLEVLVDRQALSLGDDIIDFINTGISGARVVLILHSGRTDDAVWQGLEIKAALWSELTQKGGRCLVLKLDAAPLPPVLGPKLYGDLRPESYDEVLRRLCQELHRDHPSTLELVTTAFAANTKNPFWRVRAEFFEDRPDLLANTFSPPEALKLGALEEMKPSLLEGPRGTGKSMLLLSLRARNLFSRESSRRSISELFGFYLRLTRCSLANAGIVSDDDSDPRSISPSLLAAATDAFAQELVLVLLESLISELDVLRTMRAITLESNSERFLASHLSSQFSGSTSIPCSLTEILTDISRLKLKLSEYIRRRFIYSENDVRVPIASLDLDTLRSAIRAVRESIPQLQNALFVVLLDEYENLFPFQQRVLNGFIKLAPPSFTIKVAKKTGGSDTFGTTTGQDLQERHDYNRLHLVYEVQDRSQFETYKDLLGHITENILRGAGHKEPTIGTLLPAEADPIITSTEWLREIAALAHISPEEFACLAPDVQANRRTYWGEAAVYRALYRGGGRHRDIHFSGFDTLALLSSGVIRFFQEILGIAYHLQSEASTKFTDPIVLSPQHQSAAVHIVSEHSLTSLSRNVERLGERLKYFALDLGDCLRHKLLTHLSEPEAARITIVDPEFLDDPEYHDLQRALNVACKEGLFQTKDGRPAFRPKHSEDPQPAEFNFCRVYAPALQISPRFRWRTNLHSRDLKELWEPASRARAKRRLLRAVSGPPDTDEQSTIPFPVDTSE